MLTKILTAIGKRTICFFLICIFFQLPFFQNNLCAQNLDLSWVKKIGGPSSDVARSVKIDASGNVYVAGGFTETVDFDPGAGVFNMTAFGTLDIFVTKLDASGNFIWAKQMGGISNDVSTLISIDVSGNVIICGLFSDIADFDPGPGTFNLSADGLTDIFVAKLDADGNFIWAKQYGSGAGEGSQYIGSDANDNVYLTGYFYSTMDFDPGPAVYNMSAVIADVFVTKLDASGNFVWAKKLGGFNSDMPCSFLVDNNGNSYTVGHFLATADFDPGPGIYNLTAISLGDMFICKLDASGNFVWVKQIAGSSSLASAGNHGGITIGTTGNIYVTGNFNGTFDFDPGPAVFNMTSNTFNEFFVLKLDGSGNFNWAKHIATAQGTSNSGMSVSRSIATDASGNVYTFSSFINTVDFDPGPAVYNLTSFGYWDMFISTLDDLGNFVSAKQLGGLGDDFAGEFITGPNNDFFAVGLFYEVADFDPCTGSYNLTSSGWGDCFVEKFASPAVSITSSAVTICSGTAVTFTANPVNEGPSPVYQWQVNGVNVGTNSAAFTTSTLNNNDQVKVILISNASCVPETAATSNIITVTVNTTVIPSVAITTPNTTICVGESVSFSAIPVNEGTTPTYQWQVNGLNVGYNSATYITTALVNGDVVKVIMTSNADCAAPGTVNSNEIIMTVSAGGPATISITSTATTICAGSSTTFTAIPVNGGSAPAYQWFLNGGLVGTNSPTYTDNALANGDAVKATMISNLSCATGSPATSNIITMVVNPMVVPLVTISTPNSAICTGTPLTFTAVPTNGGAAPDYQWQVNGVNAGTNSSTFTTSALMNGDVVNVLMTSNASCVTIATAISNSIAITVYSSPLASVSITSSGSTICPGTSVTFTAVSTYGGVSPGYQWMINSISVGTNSATYTTNTLGNGDLVKVIMTSDISCAIGSPATSNTISMVVNPVVIPAVTISASSTSICPGSAVTFTAAPTNGGSTPSYQWQVNGINAGMNNSVYTTNTLANLDQIKCVLGSSSACVTSSTAISNTIQMTVTTSINPTISISASANNICPGTLVTFTASPANTGTLPFYQWQLNGVNVGENSLSYSNNNLTNGDKINCIMNTVTSCSTTPDIYSDTLIMTVSPVPLISFNPASVSITAGSSIRLNAAISGSYNSYIWTPAAGLNNPAILNPIASPVTSAIYRLTVVTNNSCKTEKNLPVNVYKNIYIPNSFTPNGDTKNDIFRIPPGTALNLQYFQIYNRYGEIVFKTSDINNAWDGNYKGVKSPAGTYTYIIKGTDLKGEVFLQGSVIVLR